MQPDRLAVANELATVREEIARLKRRERVLVLMHSPTRTFPAFRPGWPLRRVATPDGTPDGV